MNKFTLVGEPSVNKYFWADETVTLRAACPKCERRVGCPLGEFEYPDEQTEVYFCCEDCDDFEFSKKIKLLSKKAEYVFEIGDEVEVYEEN